MVRTAVGAAAAGAAIAAAGYVTLVGNAWMRFGRGPGGHAREDQDALLDAFVPVYDVVERHHIVVDAPASVTLASARALNAGGSYLSRAIFKTRELVMGAENKPMPAGGLLAAMLQIGWGVLAEQPEREIVLGAVTRPWEPSPVFRTIPASEFAAFNEPGYVKIALTLRADALGDDRSVFRTETRAIATDAEARRLFRRYWALVSPGVALIRLAMLKPVKAAAESAAAREH
ncbi:MAG TPA: hypothetical protein VFK57_25110 [Vicinamibacterales bacterium]|nr:hypothetical protein [Vicinamibacterales bacterium]